MNQYEVTLLSTENYEDRRTLLFQADDFAHAEEQAEPYIEDNEEIVKISKDYVPVDVVRYLQETT